MFLSMFIANVDLIHDGSEKEEKEEIAKPKDPNEHSSGDYVVSEQQMFETLELLFEGQTRKFTSINYLTQLCGTKVLECLKIIG